MMSFVRNLSFCLSLLTGALCVSAQAHAACTGPAAPGGKIIYNNDHGVLQYCDDTDWIAFPKAAASGPSWSTPAVAKFTASDGAADDGFSHSVSISGDTAIVGSIYHNAPGADSGAAYIYTKSGGVWSQTQKLTAADAAAYDYFGKSVSISGDVAVVSAHQDDDVGGNSGSIYVFTRSGGVWSQTTKLTAADGAAGEAFGRSVSISGNYILAGSNKNSPGTNAGAAYVFQLSGGVWSQMQKLTASDAAAFDAFGDVVFIDGTSAFIAATGEDDAGSDAGAVYVFNLSGGVWTQAQKLLPTGSVDDAAFGASIYVSGDIAVFGAPYAENSGIYFSGAAFVFAKSGGTWTHQMRITADDIAADDSFGASVAILGTTVFVGSYGHEGTVDDAGAVYAFSSSGGTWPQTAKITLSGTNEYDWFGISLAADDGVLVAGSLGDDAPADNAGAVRFLEPGVANSVPYNWDQAASESKSVAAAGVTDDYFGYGVAIDGDTAVIGAYGDDQLGSSAGAAYIFTRSGGIWTQTQKITAADGAAGDRFGYDVAIDGDVIVIGSQYDDDMGSNSGSAYIFTLSGGVWSQAQKITASDGATNDYFGYSIDVSGDVVISGAYRDNSYVGSAYIFTRSGGVWTQTQKLTASDGAANDFFGYSVSVSGDVAVSSSFSDDDAGSNSGSAYVFTRSGGVWSQTQKLTASDAAAGDQFGVSVSVSGEDIIIGATYNDTPDDSGSAYIFSRSGGVWSETQKLVAADAEAYKSFGNKVTISGDVALVSAYYDTHAGGQSGAAYVFTRSGGVWTQAAKLTASDATAVDHYGWGSGISGNTALIGAPFNDQLASNAGAAYFHVVSAQCSNPTHRPGTIIYNEDDRVLQWCAGDEWQAAGPVGPVTAQSGCSNPAGTGGLIVYNEDHNVMQYCDGADWIGIGK